jgi:hypothetical protein
MAPWEAEAPSEARWSHNLAQTSRWADQLRSTANQFARDEMRVGAGQVGQRVNCVIRQGIGFLWAQGDAVLPLRPHWSSDGASHSRFDLRGWVNDTAPGTG